MYVRWILICGKELNMVSIIVDMTSSPWQHQ